MTTTRRVCAILATGLLAACAPHTPRRAQVEVDSRDIVILRPYDVALYTQQTAGVLAAAFPGAETVPLARIEEAFARAMAGDKVLVIPNVDSVPMELWAPLEAFVRQGGAALFWGRDPFARMIWSSPAGLQDEKSFTLDLVKNAVEVLTPIRRCRHMNQSGRPKGAVRVAAEDTNLPWPAVLVAVEDLRLWDGVVMEEVDASQLPGNAGAAVFFARGDTDTSYLSIRCEEGDGSRWSRVLELSDEWRPALLHEQSFHYDGGGEGRGGPDDHFQFKRASRIFAGLDMDLAAMGPGRHEFGLSDIRFAADPRPREAISRGPGLPLLAPEGRFETTTTGARLSGGGPLTVLADTVIQSPAASAMGWGGRASAAYRWIPIADASRAPAGTVGWPASLRVEAVDSSNVSRCAWVTLEADSEPRQLVVDLLRATAGRMQRGYFLHHSGCQKATFAPGEILNVNMDCADERPPRELRVAAELLDEHGAVIRRKSALRQPGSGNMDISLGAAPVPREAGESASVRVVLTDAAGREIVDEITQHIQVLASGKFPTREPRIAVNGHTFVIDRRPVFLHGIAYDPLMRPPSGASWLDVAHFDADALRRDFGQIRDAGFNMIQVEYTDESHAPQLQCVTEEARRHRLWVLLSLPVPTRGAWDLDALRRALDAAGLRKEPRIFAVDIPCVPALRTRADRRALDSHWREWLREQFGDEANAEKVIGRALWRDGDEITNPPDEEFSVDGDHRAAIETYRRFLDDFAGRRCGEVRRLLAEMELGQLFTTGNPGPWGADRWLADPLWGAAHVDFVSINAAGLLGDRAAFLDAGYMGAYGRSAGGKPVVWSRFGAFVGQNPRVPDLANQSRIFEQTFDLVRLNGIAGGYARQYAGGWREAERSDYGVVDLARAWRPCENPIRGFSRQLRQYAPMLSTWRGNLYDRAADARGVRGLMETRGAQAREEIRPAGFGQETVDIAILAVGNMPHVSPAPLAGINAEWGGIRIGGRAVSRVAGVPVRVRIGHAVEAELINTGPVTWSPSVGRRDRTVWVHVRGADGADQYLVLPGLTFGQRAWVSWKVPGPGVWTLRPWLGHVGEFGEALHMEAAETSAK